MGPRAFTASAFCRLSDPRQPHGRPRGERRSHPRAQLGNFSRTCKPRSLRRGKEANPTFCSLPDFLAGLFCVCMYGGRLVQSFLAGSTLGKGRFEEFKATPTGFADDLRDLLSNHELPPAEACQEGLLFKGCRYLTPRKFCSAVGWTNSQSSNRDDLFHHSRRSGFRYKLSEVLCFHLRSRQHLF